MPNPHARFVIAAIWLVVVQAGAQISLPLPAEIDKSDAEFSAAGDKPNSARRTDHAVCDEKMGNAKDVCVQEAKSRERVARVESDHRRNPSDGNARRVAEAKVQAAYDVAMQKCDDHSSASCARRI